MGIVQCPGIADIVGWMARQPATTRNILAKFPIWALPNEVVELDSDRKLLGTFLGSTTAAPAKIQPKDSAIVAWMGREMKYCGVITHTVDGRL